MTQEATFGNMVQCHCSSYCGLTSSRFQWQLPEVKRAHMTIEMNGIHFELYLDETKSCPLLSFSILRVCVCVCVCV